MGRSQHQKIKTHDRIVRAASKRLREKGLDGVAIADLMAKELVTIRKKKLTTRQYRGISLHICSLYVDSKARS
jgi:hypothetical protein